MVVGIEAMNLYGGRAFIDVRALFAARELNLERFDNLMMVQKAVGLPCEDPITHAVNAAKPLIDALDPEERNKIELVIAATESGIDFGKSMSTYIHDYLGLSRTCRMFEIKQACYGGTAGLQMAAAFVASGFSPGAKALVIATDAARAAAVKTYAEPSQGTGAVAMLIGNQPDILELDLGATGYHGYEVMDTCRPRAEIELGDSDLSLLSYLDCLERCYETYCERVSAVNFSSSFDYFAFHTPFGGMVKGAHRKLMRRQLRAAPEAIEADFQKRLGPSLKYCVRVGNLYSATVYMALCGLIDSADLHLPRRIGLFSYGSGCSSEFYSGISGPRAQKKLAQMAIGARLDDRHELNMQDYDLLLNLNMEWIFGIQNKQTDTDPYGHIYERYLQGRKLLVLKQIHNFHREYSWS